MTPTQDPAMPNDVKPFPDEVLEHTLTCPLEKMRAFDWQVRACDLAREIKRLNTLTAPPSDADARRLGELAEILPKWKWYAETEVVHDGEHGLAVIAADPDVPEGMTPTKGMVCWVHAGVGMCTTDLQAKHVAAYIAAASPKTILSLLRQVEELKGKVAVWEAEADRLCDEATAANQKCASMQLAVDVYRQEIALLKKKAADEIERQFDRDEVL